MLSINCRNHVLVSANVYKSDLKIESRENAIHFRLTCAVIRPSWRDRESSRIWEYAQGIFHW